VRSSAAFSVYAFDESGRTSNDDEEQQFKEAVRRVLALTERELAELLRRGDFIEVNRE